MRFILTLILPLLAAAQDFSELRVEKVATGYIFTEGPALSREGFLLFSDVPANHIIRYVPGKGAAVYRENTNGGNGNTFDAKDRLYTCESRTRRVIRTDKKGKVEVLAEKFQGKRLNAPTPRIGRAG